MPSSSIRSMSLAIIAFTKYPAYMSMGKTLSYSPLIIIWRSPPFMRASGLYLRLGKSHDRYERFAENSFVRGLIQPRTSCLSSPSGIAVTSVANAERNPSSATGVPTSGLPFIMRTCSVLFNLPSMRDFKLAPVTVSQYCGSMTSEPATAMRRIKSRVPVVSSFPSTATASGLMVHTISPLFTGLTLFICTPTFPAGFAPSKTFTSAPSISPNVAFWFGDMPT